MNNRKLILKLCLLGLIDSVIPVPILAIILIHAILTRPKWFLQTLAVLQTGTGHS